MKKRRLKDAKKNKEKICDKSYKWKNKIVDRPRCNKKVLPFHMPSFLVYDLY